MYSCHFVNEGISQPVKNGRAPLKRMKYQCKHQGNNCDRMFRQMARYKKAKTGSFSTIPEILIN